jgi:transcriptional regulator
MYIPAAYTWTDQAELLAFMQAHSFATLVSAGAEGVLQATHLPVVVTAPDEGVRMTWHLAKANPQAETLADGEALVIFQGPHAYISPTWYEQRESVPTWNYIAVHAYGRPQRLALEQHDAVLADLIAPHEPGYQAQWESLPARYRDGMRKGIVAFEMTVSRLEAKAKLSQNRPHADQAHVAAALRGSDDPAARAIGSAMQARSP